MGRLFDLGYDRWLFSISGAVLVLSTFLVAQCREYWQFIICQGILVGVRRLSFLHEERETFLQLASGGMLTPMVSCVTHWFKKRRQLALGFTAVGSSVGGTVLPILARNLIPRIGYDPLIPVCFMCAE